MKVLTSAEMAAADKATFTKIAVPSRAIMEVAGRAAGQLLCELFGDRLSRGVVVFAGGGNNGGDGFVMARMLHQLGVGVEVALLKPLSTLKGDAQESAASWQKAGGAVYELSEGTWPSSHCVSGIPGYGVLVDAIFGTGVKGAVRGYSADIIEALNEQARLGAVPILSIDLPSGVDGDCGTVEGAVVKADVTLALQCLKVAHLIYPAAQYSGEVYLADIGISPFLPEVAGLARELVSEELARRIARDVFSERAEAHKGSRGHVLVIGGGRGHYGAPKMSAQAALTSGAGLVTLVLPAGAAAVAAPQLEELMCAELADDAGGGFSGTDEAALAALVSGKRALVVGPGIGQGEGVSKLLAGVLTVSGGKIPLVLDADALNVLAKYPALQKQLGPHVVLTPHPGEMATLLGSTAEAVQKDRLLAAKKLSTDWNCWIVLKGARTIIAGPDGGLWINPAGTPALATAGAGDVLAGVLGAIMARGAELRDAALLGVFAHGCAGEICAERRGGVLGTVAGDIIPLVPMVINELVYLGEPAVTPLRRVLPGSMDRLRPLVLGARG